MIRIGSPEAGRARLLEVGRLVRGLPVLFVFVVLHNLLHWGLGVPRVRLTDRREWASVYRSGIGFVIHSPLAEELFEFRQMSFRGNSM